MTESNRSAAEKSDWARVVTASELALCHGPAPLRPITLYVITPGQLSAEGLLRTPGTCLARRPLPGDAILDTLEVRPTTEGIDVYSARQDANSRYGWSTGAPKFDPDKRTMPEVSLRGRAASWGTLGDDSYEPGAEDAILADTLLEAFMGTGDWQIAPVYYDVREVQTLEDDDDRWIGIVAKVRAENFRAADWPVKSLIEGSH